MRQVTFKVLPNLSRPLAAAVDALPYSMAKTNSMSQNNTTVYINKTVIDTKIKFIDLIQYPLCDAMTQHLQVGTADDNTVNISFCMVK